MWIFAAVSAAFFLGIYGLLKKFALDGNAVLPVLFLATLFGSSLFILPVIGSSFNPDFAKTHFWYVAPLTFQVHILVFIKSIIVAASWILAYFALKNLPISIVAPIRSTAPVWTLTGAIILYGESYTSLQWTGLIVTLLAFGFFSAIGNKEGINFAKNKWILFVVGATLIGAGSSLYDKYLIARFPRLSIQAFFSFYLIIVLFPIVAFFWHPKRHKFTPFQWRITIPLVGVALVVADFLYFYALTFNDSSIAIISAIRRSSVVISFCIGGIVFKEKNKRLKAIALIGVLLGVAFMIFGSR